MILLDGPSGAGKSTSLSYLRENCRELVRVGSKYSTRKPRFGDNDWEFLFVESIPANLSQYAFQSVGHSYAVDIDAANQSLRDGKLYCVSCTDRRMIAKLKNDYGALVVYIARPMSEEALEAILKARGVTKFDSDARRQEHRQAGADYISKLGLIDHVILNDRNREYLYDQIDTIISLCPELTSNIE